MNIRGIYKTSLIDYPGKICTVLFSGGCNLRCRYCHNRDLACNSDSLPHYTSEEVLNFLASRKHLIEGVTLSGGEPTLSDDIYQFAASIKDYGLSVKIDTNGLKPDTLARLIERGLVDYIALDVKTSPDKYPDLAGTTVDFTLIKNTVSVLKSGDIDYEIRTTCVPGYVTGEDLSIIGNHIGPVKRYYLQQFRAAGDLIDESLGVLQPYPVYVLDEFCKRVLNFSDYCAIRGR